MQVQLNPNNYFLTSKNKTTQRKPYNNNINFNARFTDALSSTINSTLFALDKIIESSPKEGLYAKILTSFFPYKIDTQVLAQMEKTRLTHILDIIKTNYPNHKIVRRVNAQPTKAGLPPIQYYLVPQDFAWQPGKTWNVAQIAASANRKFITVGDVMNIAHSLQKDLQFTEESGFNYYANVVRPAANRAFKATHTAY